MRTEIRRKRWCRMRSRRRRRIDCRRSAQECLRPLRRTGCIQSRDNRQPCSMRFLLRRSEWRFRCRRSRRRVWCSAQCRRFPRRSCRRIRPGCRGRSRRPEWSASRRSGRSGCRIRSCRGRNRRGCRSSRRGRRRPGGRFRGRSRRKARHRCSCRRGARTRCRSGCGCRCRRFRRAR